MKRETIDKIRKTHTIFHKVLLFFCLIWLGANFTYERIPNVQLAPIYDEAIKAVDPFKDFKDGLGPKDFATQ